MGTDYETKNHAKRELPYHFAIFAYFVVEREFEPTGPLDRVFRAKRGTPGQ